MMASNDEVIEETPSDTMMEQETPDINFDDMLHAEQETPDIDFNELHANSIDQNRERFTAVNSEHLNSDIDDLDEPDQYVEKDDEIEDTNQESALSDKRKNEPKTKDNADNRLLQLPSARVKNIMKIDPDVTLITSECTFLVAKATELFIESLAREAFLHTSQAKKKTVQKSDVVAAIENVESLMFLEGMMNF